MIPFMEKILGDYLRDSSAVSGIVGDRVATKKPRTLAEPWVQVRVYDDPPAGKSSTDHNIAFYVQIDCFAGEDGLTQGETRVLAHTVRALLGKMPTEGFADAVVSGAKAAGSRYLPDDTYDAVMDRYIVTATIWAHEAL